MKVMSGRIFRGCLLGGVSLFFLFSCSNSQGIILNNQDETLRNEVSEKSKNTVWTNEIENGRLNSGLNTFINIYDNSLITPRLIQTLRDTNAPVYPHIKNLASLDTSQMNPILLNYVKEFCTKLKSEGQELDSYFDQQYFFNYVFFKKDLTDIWPQTEGKELFEHFVICKAFEADDLIQVPVRFYKDKEYIDLSLYLIYHSGYKLTQIEILGWGKLYGETEQQH